MLAVPELDEALQEGSRESRVEGENPLPQPVDHIAFDGLLSDACFLLLQ